MTKKADCYARQLERARAKLEEARGAYHAHQQVTALTVGWEEQHQALYARVSEASQELDRLWGEARRAGAAPVA